MATYRPLALVNRLDLAHEGWRNCGEYRIIYGKQVGTSPRKNLIIFEAVLPNPKPGCREGCLPVAMFWRSLSDIDDPAVRAAELEKFFYGGLPGFRPVVHVDHYSAKGVSSGYGSSGSGQIRTNQFLPPPPTLCCWVLKEFRTVIDCGSTPCSFHIVPIMVKVNPFGQLWNEDLANSAGPLQARAAAFQSDVLLQTPGLASASLGGIGYGVDLDHDAAQSFSQAFPGFIDNCRDQMNAATATVFRTALDGGGGSLSADQMVNRALAQSCAGCHMPSTFGLLAAGSIGPATVPSGTVSSWPNALAFVHVDTQTPSTPLPEFSSPTPPDIYGDGRGQPISPALKDVFIPERLDFLLEQLNAARCLCRNRFLVLDERFRLRAEEIAERVDKRFEPRFSALEDLLRAAGTDRRRVAELERSADRLVSERDQQLDAELRREGISMPRDDVQELRPQTLRLEATRRAGGDTLRAQEVLQLVKEEPARRTVTGSFRSH